MFEDKTILITGGTGSWGYELTKQLLEQRAKEIRIFSRNESKQVEMRTHFGTTKIKYILGDVRSPHDLITAMADVNSVFHLAALKHIPICENQPFEPIKTNVIGLENVIYAAINNGVDRVINVSSDKAVDPINTYGLTKALGEKLIIQANQFSEHTKFICVRAGNVLGSSGSVVPIFIESIKNENEVWITDKQMTRFFLTLGDAISLLFKATVHGRGGEIFVMRMQTCRIIDLAAALILNYGNTSTEVKMGQIRPGEKIHEVLISKHEIRNTVIYDNNYYLILPSIDIPQMDTYHLLSSYLPVSFNEYWSANNLMTTTEIEQMLEKGGFLK